MKIFLYPEYVPVLFAAQKLGRPVKWTGERSEAFLCRHAMAATTRPRAELALDKDDSSSPSASS